MQGSVNCRRPTGRTELQPPKEGNYNDSPLSAPHIAQIWAEITNFEAVANSCITRGDIRAGETYQRPWVAVKQLLPSLG
jgi:hypothetical protein